MINVADFNMYGDDSEESEDGCEDLALAIEQESDEADNQITCNGEPVPEVYEDRLGMIFRRKAGCLSDFQNL